MVTFRPRCFGSLARFGFALGRAKLRHNLIVHRGLHAYTGIFSGWQTSSGSRLLTSLIEIFIITSNGSYKEAYIIVRLDGQL